MKSRVALNIVLVLGLLALVLFSYLRPKNSETRPTIKLSQATRESVDRVKIERQGSPAIQLVRQATGWQITAPLQTQADTHQIDRVIDMVAMTASGKLPDTGRAQFGLDPAAVKVFLNDEVFSFGRINEITNEQYLGYGEAVYLVPPFYGYGIPASVNILISRKLLDEAEQPVRFDFGTYHIGRNEKGAWSIEGKAPATLATPPSQDNLNRWADEWRHTSALTAEPAAGVPAADQSLTVHFANGKSAGLRIKRTGTELQMYRADRKLVYRVGNETGQRLLDPARVAEK
ncbi:MAG: DUF4340 domain-containing protein [Burkholderiales bacterium]